MLENKKTILVVDDDSDLRGSLVSLLDNGVFNIEQAADGKEALLVLGYKTVDLLITDILMPKMDGIELIINSRKIQPELQVVLISGGGRKLESNESYDYLSLGQKLTATDHVLKKPFSPQTLIDLVNKLLIE